MTKDHTTESIRASDKARGLDPLDVIALLTRARDLTYPGSPGLHQAQELIDRAVAALAADAPKQG